MGPRSYIPTVLSVVAAFLSVEAPAQSFYGTGNDSTELVSLPAGPLVMEAEHDGSGEFVVRLTSETGDWTHALVRESNEFRGTRGVELPLSGPYRFQVAATGSWILRVVPRSIGAEGQAAAAATEQRAQGEYDAGRAARKLGGGPYLIGGLVGGTLAGPIGAGVAFAVAGGRDTSLPSHLEASLANQSDEYKEAFREAFPGRLRSTRRASALIGGAAGSAVFFFVLIQFANWDSGGSGGTIPPPPEVP